MVNGMPFGAAFFSVLICILFGANPAVMKISLKGLGPFTNAAIRFSFAALCILLWARATGKPLSLKKEQFVRIALLGVLFSFQLSFFFIGISKTTATHGALIMNLQPFVVMVLAHFFIPDDGITFKTVTGLIFGFAGVLILLADAPFGGGMFEGDLFVLAAVLLWGINAVFTKRIITTIHPVTITLYPMLLASPVFILNAFLWNELTFATFDTGIVLALAYQILVTASFGMVAWNYLISRYGATNLHSFIFIMPLSGVFLGVFMLGEAITPYLVVAMIMVTTGLIIVNRRCR
ncbi:MAG: multidrug DMT transporter permease [Proteobacteria bacterium]|nr:MAG: multidrug DMT transporter permease [Pseudomonadota bacterium]PIE65212.1 MAG: multidrug DMT transporter permease [Desulfobacterales bacterium]